MNLLLIEEKDIPKIKELKKIIKINVEIIEVPSNDNLNLAEINYVKIKDEILNSLEKYKDTMIITYNKTFLNLLKILDIFQNLNINFNYGLNTISYLAPKSIYKDKWNINRYIKNKLF